MLVKLEEISRILAHFVFTELDPLCSYVQSFSVKKWTVRKIETVYLFLWSIKVNRTK